MKPEIIVTRTPGFQHSGRVEIVEPDGQNSTFHLWGVSVIEIKHTRQPEVRVMPRVVHGQFLSVNAIAKIRTITNTGTNEYPVPDGYLAIVRWIERERTPSI